PCLCRSWFACSPCADCRRRGSRCPKVRARRGCPADQSMKPEIHLLGISIKTFGLAFALGFLACGLVVARRLRELGKPVDWAYEIVFAALIGGVVGARGYCLIQNYERVKQDLVGSAFSGSGLVRYGGALGGGLAVVA